MPDLSSRVTQGEFAAMVGISQPAVSALIAKGVLKNGDPAGAWLHSYCANLREQAAGRASDGGLDLVQERARLAKEQADKFAMVNAQTRKELAPISLIELVLANMARQVAGVLEALPIQIKRAAKNLSSEDLRLITDEIAKARNMAAALKLDWDEIDGLVGNSASD